jgi:hypothetical protein
MSNLKTIAALFLSLLLALSTTASLAHNLYYHSTDIQQNDFSNHFVDYDHDEHEGHEGHDESGCVFTVIQYSESLLAHEIPAVSLSVFGDERLNYVIAAQSSRPENGFFARAPPTSV